MLSTIKLEDCHDIWPTDNFLHVRCAVLVLLYSTMLQFGAAAEPAMPGDFPFFVTLIWDGQARCGATLYTASCLFTACHCLLKDIHDTFKFPHVLQDPANIKVEAGNESARPSGQTRIGKVVRVHPNCEGNKTGIYYNYGVIVVREPFTLRQGHVEVVDILGQKNGISQAVMEPDNLTCIALDFGILHKEKTVWDLDSLLINKDVTLKDGDWCTKTFSDFKFDFDRNTQVCTSRRWLNREICNALLIFGGPLICRRSGNEGDQKPSLIIGLLTARHCSQHIKEVYARLDAGIDWLRDVVDCHSTTIEPVPGPTEHTLGPTSNPDGTTGSTNPHTRGTGTGTGLSPGPYTIPANPVIPHSSSPKSYYTVLTSIVCPFTNVIIKFIMN